MKYNKLLKVGAVLTMLIKSNISFGQLNNESDSIKTENFKTQTSLDSFIGIHKVKVLYRRNKNVSSLEIKGEILLTENGVTLRNILSIEDEVRCTFDRGSYIPLEKGTFPIKALKSFYSDGVFTINLKNKIGSTTLNYSRGKNETVSFILLE